MNILGISRSPRFSPHSVDRDAAIFSAVSARMLRGRNRVSVISEDLFIDPDLSEFDLIFSMARDSRVLRILAEAEAKYGIPVFNSAQAIIKYDRSHLTQLFSGLGLSQPPSRIIRLSSERPQDALNGLKYPLWIKRGESCAQSEGDVCFAENAEAVSEILEKFSCEGIRELVVSEHASGDLIKFYGVEGTPFFDYSYPMEEGGFSKFGLEEHNGRPTHYVFSLDDLKKLCTLAARKSGFTIYGGDAVICPDGTPLIIDFNDWPSFASCRKEAAKAIATRIKSVCQE